eukprot:760061-Hanusia_phi.AAC.3
MRGATAEREEWRESRAKGGTDFLCRPFQQGRSRHGQDPASEEEEETAVAAEELIPERDYGVERKGMGEPGQEPGDGEEVGGELGVLEEAEELRIEKGEQTDEAAQD